MWPAQTRVQRRREKESAAPTLILLTTSIGSAGLLHLMYSAISWLGAAALVCLPVVLSHALLRSDIKRNRDMISRSGAVASTSVQREADDG